MDQNNLNELPMTLTVVEIAKMLRLGRNTTYQLVQEGKIRSIRCGHKIIVPKEALQEFLSKTDGAD